MDDSKLEDNITRKLVQYTNRIHDVGKKAEAARAVVYSGNGTIKLSVNEQPRKFRKVLATLALTAFAYIGVWSVFDNQRLRIENDQKQNEICYSSQQFKHKYEIAAIRENNLQEREKQLREKYTALVQETDAKLHQLTDDFAQVDAFTRAVIKKLVQRRPYRGFTPWDSFVDGMGLRMYGISPCLPLRRIIDDEMRKCIILTPGKTIDQTLDEWNKTPFATIYFESRGVKK